MTNSIGEIEDNEVLFIIGSNATEAHPIIGNKMKKANIVIENETGLHARPATELAKLAMKYKCSINLIVNGKLIDAKSPLMIMSAGIKYKTELEIICDGENEDKALEEVKSFLENNIG